MNALALPVLLLFALAGGPAEDVELAELIEKVRANAWRSKQAVFDYSFVQHERSVIKTPKGKVVDRHDRKFRVVPVQGGLVRELLEVDGREPTAKELKQNEKQNRKALAQRRRKLGTEEEEAEQYVAGLTQLIDLLSRTDYEIAGREERAGREVLAVAFEPSVVPGEKGVTKKVLKHVGGTVWLDAMTGEPVALALGNADKFRVRGVLGIKDVSFRMEQVRIHDELWLPRVVEVESFVSLLGVKRRYEARTVFSEHRKAVVTVEEELEDSLEPDVEALLSAGESAEEQ